MTIQEFTRTGPIKSIASYPLWAQEMAARTLQSRAKVAQHDLFRLMGAGKLPLPILQNFLIGGWPLIEQFPKYMAQNLTKIVYGHSKGGNMARRFLMKNIRVEESHAEQWINWAEASGVSREQLLQSRASVQSFGMSLWCFNVCKEASLPVAMAATNYAIEGVTGEWTALVCESGIYAETFPEKSRRKAMNWLASHNTYDDEHPWQALEIICTLMGTNPSATEVDEVVDAVMMSFDSMRVAMDAVMVGYNAAEVMNAKPNLQELLLAA